MPVYKVDTVKVIEVFSTVYVEAPSAQFIDEYDDAEKIWDAVDRSHSKVEFTVETDYTVEPEPVNEKPILVLED